MSINDFKRLLQELVVPDIQAIKVSLSTMEVEIRRLDERASTETKRLDEKIDSLKGEIRNARDDIRNIREDFKLAIDLHERIAAIETKLSLH